MITVTKSQLTDLFNGSKSYEEMAEDFTTQAGVEITAKMVQDLFRANDFNLRSRTRKPKNSWFTVIDDTTSSLNFQTPTGNIPVADVVEELTEEFA